ncbi:restriction endonuclease subunit S [Gordonibacter sp.]|uniref:restriction endonuclease subunit S n=1 Tax=Gordonibacter sp. TaxID=1968902 RepID=UPI002FCC9087
MKTLSSLCQLIVDCPHSTAPDEGDGFPLIRTPNIEWGYFNLEGVHRVSRDTYNKRNIRAVPQNDDLILAREAPAGNVAIIQNGDKVCLGQRTVLIRPDHKEVDPMWLNYYLNAPEQRHALLKNANGATVSHVNMPIIRNLPVKLPDRKTQERIAGILSAYDKLIENNRKQIKLLEEAAQRLYKEWFIDLKFPGHESTPIDPTTNLPEGWHTKELGNLVPIRTGKRDANFGSENGRFLFFTCAQKPIRADSYSFDGDAIILSGNGDFSVCLYRGKFEAYQRTYVLIPPNKTNLFVSFAAISCAMSQLANGANGSTIKYLTKRMIEEIPVICPQDGILEQFNSVIEAIQSKIEVLECELKNSQEARNRLLPKLMSGEIEVQP